MTDLVLDVNVTDVLDISYSQYLQALFAGLIVETEVTDNDGFTSHYVDIASVNVAAIKKFCSVAK